MDWLYAISKGILQGATEFIPVSSSAHLVLFRCLSDRWGQVPPNPFVDEFFDILLHLGTLLAVVIYFRHEIFRFLHALRHAQPTVIDNNGQAWQTRPLLWAGILAFSMTSVLALLGMKGSEWVLTHLQSVALFKGCPDITQFYMAHPAWVGANLLLTGFFLAFAEWRSAQGTTSSGETLALSTQQALGIGAVQSVAALFRGISRSGSTMATGVLMGLTRTQAARFSFWLSIPIFAFAAFYESLKLFQKGIPLVDLNWGMMLSGLVVSFVVGYACIAWLLKLLSRFPLTIFSYYCWGLGLAMIFYFA